MAQTGSGLPEEIRKLTASFAEMQNKENKRLLAGSVREGTDRTHSERSAFAEEWKNSFCSGQTAEERPLSVRAEWH